MTSTCLNNGSLRCTAHSLLWLTVIMFWGCARTTAGGELTFNRDIRPLLADRCFPCHGPDANHREAGLRLDRRDTAIEMQAIVPGKPAESGLVERILAEDPELRMPPAGFPKSLNESEQARIIEWIRTGANYQPHWALIPPRRPALPGGVPENEASAIDRFLVRRLASEGWSFSRRASKPTLIRRLTLDLTGLPPTPREVTAFVEDDDPLAYVRLVERLLASPAFGERMAWDWMEVARYADSNGYQGDRERTMWPWRDWVVDAFNQGLAYDQFTLWQLAGDLLPQATFEQKLATGFCRNHPINGEGGRIPEENRVDYVMDMAETTATVWLGVTLTCARCHDHKFDPISRKEYYQLFAYFNQTPVTGGGGDPQTAPVVEYPPGGDKPEAKVMVMTRLDEPRKTFMLDKGLYNKRQDEVSVGTPAALSGLPPNAPANRLGLASWLVSDDHPLTARVTVNRVWQMFFGTGLVKTAEDFGVQGEYPSHPELLDWLAVEFRESGWDVKHLVRLIVTSNAYQQTSSVSPEKLERDPENRLVSRGARFRMPSWMLRDQALAASGLLVRQQGGPPVKPYQPAGVWSEATFGKKTYQQDQGAALYRRSLYTFWRRIVGPTMFFDTGSRLVCAVKPTRTNSPLHALTTLNDVTFVEAARVLAGRVMRRAASPEERLELAFRHVLARDPRPEETATLLAGLARVRAEYGTNPQAADELLNVGESPREADLPAVEHAAWTAVCLALLNLDETLTKE